MSLPSSAAALIPFSPRERERAALAERTFALDGKALPQLEAAVAAYHGCAHAVAFDTPASALEAALNGAGRVITDAMAPPHRHTALSRSGAQTVYADIGLGGVLIGSAIADAVNAETTTVLFAHFEGIRSQCPALPPALTLIEDITASLAPAPISATAVWSLSPLMPEGVSPTGFLLTDDDASAAHARLFRSAGRKPGSLWNYDLPLRGADCTLDLLAAAVGLEQMTQLEAACERRRENSTLLDERLGASTLFDRMKRAPDDAPASYPVLLTPQLYCPKEDIYTGISAKGVEAAVCCKPLYKTTAFKDDSVRLPVTEDFYKALLQLPCHHRLTSSEAEQVAAVLLEATEKYAYRGCRF
ncbi:DegT/DnrJ/EryC1/StrS family aminotransferase [Sulfurimonas sp. HSL1-2]|uniref:DegT/DnrJ/EryC1/StrS family aminotransferase n=1 Tax=Thiomicrolovo zhangzhouensis TaxID=3131933 RepID=UPI0031F9227C